MTRYNIFNPIPADKILGFLKRKLFADATLKFDKYGRKFSIQIENTVGKGKIAHLEQFFLFSLCFQKICTVHIKTRACLRKG